MRVRESFNHRKFKFASRNFYPEFLAVIEIMQDYRRYFPDIVPIESTVSMRYTLKNRIKFPALAKHLGISTKELQKLNPSYTSRAVNGRLYLPSGYWMNLPPGSDLVKLEMEMYNPDKEILAEPSEPLHRETFRITDSRITPSEHIPELSKTEFKAGNSYQKPGVMSEESIPRLSPENWNGLISFVESYPPEIMQEIERDIRGYLEISNNRVNVLANETLGHFADWLGIPLHYLQKLNNMGRRRTIYQGQRLRLDFSRVSPEEFSRKRHEYHLEILKSFMREKEFVNLAEYQINRGESVWELAKNRYQIPLEIIQYFNIRMDINRLYPGDVLRIPTFQSYNSLEETL
ncbi:MAG: LysM peptidoglycan-binding domain-containing protein, partial [Calditrichaeota bacterium]|nr:LysM peptidoglycan-binding domain-containing protein [Calditrichota bacterium]